MRRFAVALAICFLGLVAGIYPAAAWIHGSAGGTTCLNGGGSNDNGCALALGTISYPILTNSAYGPGTPGSVITALPPYNVAGSSEDGYAVGPKVGSTSLDPALSQPANCTYNATGGQTGGPALSCSGANLVINGYNFAATGGHDCTLLFVTSTSTGTVTVTNNNFDSPASGNCNTPLSNGSFGSMNWDIENNVFNGECPNSGSCGSNTNLTLNFPTSGSIKQKYNAFLFFPERPEGAGGSATVSTYGDLDLEYNLFLSFSIFEAHFHGEVIEQTMTPNSCCATQAHTTYIGNTCILTNQTGTVGGGGFATACFYISGGSGLPTYSNTTFNNNVTFVNKNSSSGIPGAAIGVDFTNGTYTAVTANNNYFYTPASSQFACNGIQTKFTGVIASDVLTTSGVTGYAPATGKGGVLQGQALWLSNSHGPLGATIGTQISSNDGSNAVLSGATISGTVVSFASNTGTLNGKTGAAQAPYPGDLLVGAGVANGTHLVSAINSTSWNIDVSQTEATPETMTSYASSGNGTFNITAADQSSQPMIAYAAGPPNSWYGDAVMPSISMAGNVDMISGGSLNTIQKQSNATCPLP